MPLPGGGSRRKAAGGWKILGETTPWTVPDTALLPVAGATVGSADQLTTLFAQLLLANASGLALKAKPIPSI